MRILNLEETIEVLRGRLKDYLFLHEVITNEKKKFCCISHEERTPSMCLNPKNGYTTAHCFSCNETVDIFRAASILESLPDQGSEWITETIPKLCEELNIPIVLGEITEADKKKFKLLKLASDIDDIISAPIYRPEEYIEERNWANDFDEPSSISEEILIDALTARNWSLEDINNSGLVKQRNPEKGTWTSFFGSDKITFTYRDHRGRPIGFMSRNLINQPKYINTPETIIFSKAKSLIGLELAYKTKEKELIIVEGPGDRAQLLRLGVTNVVAICGTAFTKDHLTLLRTLGFSRLSFFLDWDEAGHKNTIRIFEDVMKGTTDMSTKVYAKAHETLHDPDEYFKSKGKFDLTPISSFDWLISALSHLDSVELAEKLIPTIASEPTAIKRDILLNQLASKTGLSYQSILSDVTYLRDRKAQERTKRILAAVDQYKLDIENSPHDISSLLSSHEALVQEIETEYNKESRGVNYQLSRVRALRERKEASAEESKLSFHMEHFKTFEKVMSTGLSWTSGCVFYFGGRAHSGKTSVTLMIGLDVAMHDNDAIVVYHQIDDTLEQVEPRIITHLSHMMNKSALTIGEASRPTDLILTDRNREIYVNAANKLEELVAEERLVLLDSDDGNTFSVVERVLRDLRHRYPEKKILVVCDNTHNYADFSFAASKTDKMEKIADLQKAITRKYKCCMMATVEYRKNLPQSTKELKLPQNEDIADSRALAYRGNVIIHVYNDLNDRQDDAEGFWIKAGQRMPRLLLLFYKNKISGFSERLVLDLDKDSITLKEISEDQARYEFKMSNLDPDDFIIEADE